MKAGPTRIVLSANALLLLGMAMLPWWTITVGAVLALMPWPLVSWLVVRLFPGLDATQRRAFKFGGLMTLGVAVLLVSWASVVTMFPELDIPLRAPLWPLATPVLFSVFCTNAFYAHFPLRHAVSRNLFGLIGEFRQPYRWWMVPGMFSPLVIILAAVMLGV